MKVKRILLLVAVGCGALGFAWQQQAQKYVLLDDKKGGFKIYDVESAMTSFQPDGDASFDASGHPVRGFSKEQGLVFSANRIEGTAKQTAESFRISTGKLSGNVNLNTTTDAGGTKTESHLEGQSLMMLEEATQTKVTLPSAFLFTNHVVSSKLDRTLTMRAPSGTFYLPLLDQQSSEPNPFRSADVKGPITIKIDTKQVVTAGTTRQIVDLKADHMTYTAATRTLRLEGNITGDLTMVNTKGETRELGVNATWVNVEFDEDSAVKLVTSGIGEAVFRDKDGGGK